MATPIAEVVSSPANGSEQHDQHPHHTHTGPEALLAMEGEDPQEDRRELHEDVADVPSLEYECERRQDYTAGSPHHHSGEDIADALRGGLNTFELLDNGCPVAEDRHEPQQHQEPHADERAHDHS